MFVCWRKKKNSIDMVIMVVLEARKRRAQEGIQSGRPTGLDIYFSLSTEEFNGTS